MAHATWLGQQLVLGGYVPLIMILKPTILCTALGRLQTILAHLDPLSRRRFCHLRRRKRPIDSLRDAAGCSRLENLLVLQLDAKLLLFELVYDVLDHLVWLFYLLCLYAHITYRPRIVTRHSLLTPTLVLALRLLILLGGLHKGAFLEPLIIQRRELAHFLREILHHFIDCLIFDVLLVLDVRILFLHHWLSDFNSDTALLAFI